MAGPSIEIEKLLEGGRLGPPKTNVQQAAYAMVADNALIQQQQLLQMQGQLFHYGAGLQNMLGAASTRIRNIIDAFR